MIIGIDGPVEVPPDTPVLMFESLLFDRSKSSKSKLDSSRLTLENRWAMVENPHNFLENIVGSLDAVETELSNFSGIICLHSNDILLTGTKETALRLKAIAAKSKAKIVLSISVPPDIRDESLGTEYLVSHVHYGAHSGSIFFGLIGPFTVREDASVTELKMYLNAQQRTNGVLLTITVESVDRFKELLSQVELNWNRTVVFGITAEQIGRANVVIGVTFPADRLEYSALQVLKSSSTCVMATGTAFKTDMKKYGGRGMEFGLNFVKNKISISQWNDMNARALRLLNFYWDPPKLNVKNEDSPKWVCHICGTAAKFSEKENYTKHGFTYCSIACLAEHRKKGFQD